MNLHGIVKNIISAVNPLVACQLQSSTGYGISPDGTQGPTYALPVTIACQIQSLTYQDLMKLDGLNIQGIRRGIYIDGYWEGVVRPAVMGGDLITFPDATVWLVAQALETWPDWSKVAATLQNGS